MDALKHLGLIIVFCLFSVPAQAAVTDLKTNNDGAGITSAPNESALGSKMKVDNDFNANSVQKAFDDSKPEDNIKTVVFDPHKIIKVRLRLNMNALIVLPEGEGIKAFILADSYVFTATPISQEMENMISLKGMVAGTDTNLKIIGESGKIYNFYLRTDPVDSKFVPDFTIYIREASNGFFFTDKEGESNILKGMLAGGKSQPPGLSPPPYPVADLLDLQSAKIDYLKSLPDPEKANIAYMMDGDYEIAPAGVYDDEQWTYFDFRKKLPSDRLPVIYKVVDGVDTLVNTRFEKGFLIAESISKEGWTLLNGLKVICIKHTR